MPSSPPLDLPYACRVPLPGTPLTLTSTSSHLLWENTGTVFIAAVQADSVTDWENPRPLTETECTVAPGTPPCAPCGRHARDQSDDERIERMRLTVALADRHAWLEATAERRGVTPRELPQDHGEGSTSLRSREIRCHHVGSCQDSFVLNR